MYVTEGNPVPQERNFDVEHSTATVKASVVLTDVVVPLSKHSIATFVSADAPWNSKGVRFAYETCYYKSSESASMRNII